MNISRNFCDMLNKRYRELKIYRLMDVSPYHSMEKQNWLERNLRYEKLSKRGMNFEQLSLADSFPQLFLTGSSKKSVPFLNMKTNLLPMLGFVLKEYGSELPLADGLIKIKKPNHLLRKLLLSPDEGSSNIETDKIMARMDAMTIKMDAQYKELQSRAKQPTPDLEDDDMPIVPLVDVLAGMPNYGKFLKELIRNKHKIEQFFAAFLSDKSSAMIQNKVPPKLVDPGSFLIPCNFNKTFSCNALSDLGASINLMPYSLYAKLSLKTLKPTKMSIRLAERSFQYPVGIAENMLIEVGKFTFPADFIIFETEEDIKVPLILGRPFLHTADAVIQVK
ncbi:reverse transcriptase domain-containing protein [Tanacetum coccineum]|uniref:Reverse transcriptase domain-containing protein n=1 Tax=Tanacetum coccineum TaxID=301880 RepID=A0ABQ5B3A2_9ASTR